MPLQDANPTPSFGGFGFKSKKLPELQARLSLSLDNLRAKNILLASVRTVCGAYRERSDRD